MLGCSKLSFSGGTPPCLSLWERCPSVYTGAERALSVTAYAVPAPPKGEPSLLR